MYLDHMEIIQQDSTAGYLTLVTSEKLKLHQRLGEEELRLSGGQPAVKRY
jgi:hypothetical protein